MPSRETASSNQPQSPFFRASQTDRYERQAQIRQYEQVSGRSLIVFCGQIAHQVITPFADAVGDVPHGHPLDLMLTSPGGNGETAKRMATMCHSDRESFRVIVPETASSAATLLALAAEEIVMANTSALGPIDPQVFLPLRRAFYPAKEIIELVDNLEDRVHKNPQAFALYSALLGDIDGLTYQIAKAATKRIAELVPEVLQLRLNTPTDTEINELTQNLQRPALHSATFSHDEDRRFGLPIKHVDPYSEEWDMLWRLHTQYVHLLGSPFDKRMIEGCRVSLLFSAE